MGGKGDQGCMVSSKRVCVANAWTSMLISSTWSGGSTHSYGQMIAADGRGISGHENDPANHAHYTHAYRPHPPLVSVSSIA